MSLQNFHVDGNKSDSEILKRSKRLHGNFISSFRHLVANGAFKFGPVKLEDKDLNRVHTIVNEIDTRRLFYNCSDDEIPRYAIKSAYETREKLRELSGGVWATPALETFVQQINRALADYCTSVEKLDPENLHMGDDRFGEFLDETLDLRLKVWLLVAMLKVNLGEIIRPIHLPDEILDQVSTSN